MTPATPNKLTYNDRQHAYWYNGKRCKAITAVSKIPDDSYTLDQWRKRMVVVGMATTPSLVDRAAAHHDDRDQLDLIAEEAMSAARAREAAAVGTAKHRIVERHDLDEEILETEITAAVLAAWKAALNAADLEVIPELVERIVVYPDELIAGRFDRICRHKPTGKLLLTDLKTGGNAPRYPHGISLQLALYSRAPLMAGPIPPSGGFTTDFEPLPDTLDLDRGIVIHLPDDGAWSVLEIDIAAGWEAARTLGLGTLRWRRRQDLVHVLASSNGSEDRPADDGLLVERIGWLKDRIKALPDAPKQELARTWPEGVTRTVRDIATHTDIDKVAGALTAVESAHSLPFHSGDPAAEPKRPSNHK